MREEKNELKRILGNTFKPWEEQKRECFRKKKKFWEQKRVAILLGMNE
jgi:hypothetical protein